MGPFIALLVTIGSGYLIIKKYKPQTVLLLGGFIMMVVALILGYGPILTAKQSTGNMWIDIFEYINKLTSTRVAELGLLIMTCAGFAKYMNLIGASEAMVKVTSKPLHYIKSPYIVLCAGFMVGQIIHPFIPSASGLGMLLMVTLYPLYRAVGISPITATAVIATNGCLDLGPSSGNSVLAAKYGGMTPVEYFINHQLIVSILISIVIMVAHYFVSRYYEKKHEQMAAEKGITIEELQVTLMSKPSKKIEAASDNPIPKYYAILPAIPLILVLAFGYFKLGGITMDINVAIFIAIFLSMIAEFARSLDLKKVFASLQIFFDGMGVQFATVVTLIIAGETFAKGLSLLKAIDFLIHTAESAGFGYIGMIIVMCTIIGICTIIMGSGNAPFFAFSAFAPDIAKRLGVDAISFLLPMQLTASVMRAASPITAVVVAVSGVAGVSPFQVIKQTWLPLLLGAITLQIYTMFMY